MNDLIATQSTEIAEIGGGFSFDYFDRWIAYIDAMPQTVITYTRAIRQFIKYLTENGITEPTRSDILAYKEDLQNKHRPTTVSTYMAAVRIFFEWAELEGYYPNIARRVRGAKIKDKSKTHKRAALNAKQSKRLLASIPTDTLQGKRDYAIIFLMLTTGLRTTSIVNANIGDISTESDPSILFIKTKGYDGKDTYVELHETAEAAIRDYLSARGAAADNAPLFGSLDRKGVNTRLTTKSISRLCKHYLIAAGFNSERYTAHSLRHSAASMMLESGSTVEEVQEVLGHSNINTTMIYVHQKNRAKNKSVLRVGDALTGN